MANGSRPLSPHLQVYRPQITSVLSITHRLTGIGLTIGILLLAWWLIAAATGPVAFARVQGFIGSWLGILVLLGWTFSLFFHLLAGIRYLVWDAGYSFELKNVYLGGWIVVGGAVVLTVLTWLIALIAW